MAALLTMRLEWKGFEPTVSLPLIPFDLSLSLLFFLLISYNEEGRDIIPIRGRYIDSTLNSV